MIAFVTHCFWTGERFLGLGGCGLLGLRYAGEGVAGVLRKALASGADLLVPIRREIERRQHLVSELLLQNAVLAFISTAISPNKVLDGVIVLNINVRMILKIVQSTEEKTQIPRCH